MRIIYILLVVFLFSCNKQDEWLDEKLNLSDVVPKTLPDLQGLLNRDATFNASYITLGSLATDQYYVPESLLSTLSNIPRNCYLWQKDIFGITGISDYNFAYQIIFYANVVLDGLRRIERNEENRVDYDRMKGSALFYRAYAHYNLIQTFAEPYSIDNVKKPGIPYKTSANVDEISTRTEIGTVYQNIILDLQTSVSLLPINRSYKTEPTRPAAYALLARIYLNMDEYNSSKLYADSTLKLYSSLHDYNTLDSLASFPFASVFRTNAEVIFFASGVNYGIVSTSGPGLVDTNLINKYNVDDLRKVILYKPTPLVPGGYVFKGGFVGTTPFCGITTSEILLIRAETSIRTGNISEGINDINSLLTKRYRTGKFMNYGNINADSAINIVLTERVKELSFIGQLRWEDLRRLNKFPTTKKTLIRYSQGQQYTLPPGDKRYVYPFPYDEIRLNGIVQNER